VQFVYFAVLKFILRNRVCEINSFNVSELQLNNIDNAYLMCARVRGFGRTRACEGPSLSMSLNRKSLILSVFISQTLFRNMDFSRCEMYYLQIIQPKILDTRLVPATINHHESTT